MPANAAARRSCKFGPTVPGDFYINGELDIVVKFAVDLYGAFPVKRLFWVAESFLFGAGKAVFRPVACNQVPGARGRGQGTETLAELGGWPPSVACVSQRLDA